MDQRSTPVQPSARKFVIQRRLAQLAAIPSRNCCAACGLSVSMRTGAADLLGELREDAVHEAARVVGREPGGELDRLVDDHRGRRAGLVEQLVAPDPQQRAIDRRHPGDSPTSGDGADALVELRLVVPHALDEVGRERDRARTGRAATMSRGETPFDSASYSSASARSRASRRRSTEIAGSLTRGSGSRRCGCRPSLDRRC